VDQRPFKDVTDLKAKLGQCSKRKNGSNTFEQCVEIFRNYGVVDDVLERCEKIGQDIQSILDSWCVKRVASEGSSLSEEGTVKLSELEHISVTGFLRCQPTTLSKGVTLKEFQLIGLNWLKLLYTKKRSCILADEMGDLLTNCFKPALTLKVQVLVKQFK
jgi:SWI/SNF-related matrix-associated actin-dependent regulator of chromatin subfamily A containing DEAD/H box 1